MVGILKKEKSFTRGKKQPSIQTQGLDEKKGKRSGPLSGKGTLEKFDADKGRLM